MKPKDGFVKRHPLLLALEGWYDAPSYRFKISCRYHDILRCSVFNGKQEHFGSCFAPGGAHEMQPYYRCTSPDWAIAYLPDKHGNFMGRAFVQHEQKQERGVCPKTTCPRFRKNCPCCTRCWECGTEFPSTGPSQHYITITRVYGNKLNHEDVINAIRLRLPRINWINMQDNFIDDVENIRASDTDVYL